MHSRGGVNKLASDANAAACLSHAAFEDISYSQFAPDLLNINGSTFIGKAGVPRDDEETAKARQSSYYFLDHTVSEILLLPVAAQVIEWKDSDGRLAGERKGFSCVEHSRRERASSWRKRVRPKRLLDVLQRL